MAGSEPDFDLRGGLMVCGTASDVGKSHVVTGLCRLLARRGVRVAPFKAQNMSLNSWVTAGGHEIGRAQGVQALAAGVEPEAAMNPILLKPTSDRASQVVVMGRPRATLDAAAYHAEHGHLRTVVTGALADLRSRFDVVVVEGAGGCAEINLFDHDLVNLPLARVAGLPAVVVGDIDRGGVFASLYGSVTLLPPELRALVRGFVVNKFRGDPALLGDGPAELERRCGVPTLGVLPWIDDVALDAEDSLALAGARPQASGPVEAGRLDVAVVRFPHLSNVTDVDALCLEPGVSVRLIDRVSVLGRPDLIVLPGTKATVADLAWLRAQGLDRAVSTSDAVVLGICGGQQMMGRAIVDAVESGAGRVAGLGWLDVTTTFAAEKVTRRRQGTARGEDITGYEIHHGRVTRGPGARAWIDLRDSHGVEAEGATGADGRFLGTTLHGLFEADHFRQAFLAEVARRGGATFGPSGVSFAAARERQFDRLADLLEAHLDLPSVESIIKQGSLRASGGLGTVGPWDESGGALSPPPVGTGAGPPTRLDGGSFGRAKCAVGPVDRNARQAAGKGFDALAKPPGSLGRLELLGAQLAAIAGVSPPPLPVPAAVGVFAADHGVHAQGVTPWPQEVTAQVVGAMVAGGAAINVVARQVGASVIVVDVGLAHSVVEPALVVAPLLQRRVRSGTADLSLGPAMSVTEAEQALDLGAEVAGRLVAGGARCLVTGEVGMANTTAAAAVVAALTGCTALQTTGRGTGIDDPTLARKVGVVERALARPPVGEGALAVVASLGGLEIAALAGFIVAGAAARVPVVIDGVIAGAALLVACGLAPEVVAYCVAGHRSSEPGATAVLDHLGLQPVLDLELRLGEGTGACLALPVLEAAVRFLAEMATLDDLGAAD